MGVYIGYYRDQRQGRQLVTSVNVLAAAESDSWARTASGAAEPDGLSDSGAGILADLSQRVPDRHPQAPRLRVWQIYWINGRAFSSDWQAKAYGAVQALLGHGDDAAVILVHADPAAAGADDALLRDFLRKHWGSLDTALRGVRDLPAAARQ